MRRFILFTINIAATVLPVLCQSAAGADDSFDLGAAIRGTVDVVERDHLVQVPLDDKLSQKWFAGFLSRLDPRRMYFLQSDLKEFAPFEQRLDDLARDGNPEFATLVRQRYQQRVTEAMKFAQEFVVAPHDFSLDESIPMPFVDYPAGIDDQRDRWRLRIKFELLIEKLYGRARADVQPQLVDRYKRILRQAHEMDDQRLAKFYLDPFLVLHDSNSRYMTQEYIESFEIRMIRPYSIGIGFGESTGRLLIDVSSLWVRDKNVYPMRTAELIAIRRASGHILDVVEMDAHELNQMLRNSGSLLADDKEITLELMKPLTYERFAVKCRRFKT